MKVEGYHVAGHMETTRYSLLGHYGTFVPNPDGGPHPLVGVTVGHDTSKADNYVQAVHAAGGDAWVVSSDAFADDYARDPHTPVVGRCIRQLQGVVGTGGGDIDPRFLGMPSDPTITGVDANRDAFDRDVFLAAWKTGIPFLGICRNSQMAAHLLGGHLIPDIDTALGGSHGHRQIDQGIPKSQPTMPMQTAEGSLMRGWFGDEVAVNHDHHQGFLEAPKGMRKTGWTADGVVEAMEATNGNPVVLVQFHPELMWQNDTKYLQPFQYVVREAANHNARQDKVA